MTSPTFFSAPTSLNHHLLIHPQSLITSPIKVSTVKKYPSDSSSLRPSSADVCACACSPIRRSRNRITLSSIKASSDSTTIVDDPSVTSSSCSAAASYSEEDDKAVAKIGARVRVKVPLKVYHIPKVPEFDLNGMEGVVKQYVGVWKGKHISANLPFKVAFVADIEGRDGPVKFLAHLREDEFEYLD